MEKLIKDKNIPKKVIEVLKREDVQVINDYSIVSEHLILFNTNKGIYKYTDALYQQTKKRSGKWRKCSDGTIQTGLMS